MILATALKALILSVSIEGAYFPNATSTVYQPAEQIVSLHKVVNHVGMAKLESRALMYGFFLGGSVNTFAVPRVNDRSLYPYFAYYSFDCGYSYKALEIGYRHDCHHSVTPVVYTKPIDKIDGSYNKLYIKLSGSFRPFS